MLDLATKKKYINNINKLAQPKWPCIARHIANCGEFGIVRVDHNARNDQFGKRIFVVSKSKRLANGGCYTFATLRKAILAA